MKKYLFLFVTMLLLLLMSLSVGAIVEYENYIDYNLINQPLTFFGLADGYVDQPDCGHFVHHREDPEWHSTVVVSRTLNALTRGQMSLGDTVYFRGLTVFYNGSRINQIEYSPSTVVQLHFEYSNGVCHLYYPVITNVYIPTPVWDEWKYPNNANTFSPVFVGDPSKTFINSAVSGMNILPYSPGSLVEKVSTFDFLYSENGITFGYNALSGKYTISGTNTGSNNFTYRFYLGDNDPLLLPYKWYFWMPNMSAVSGSSGFINFRFMRSDGSTFDVNGVRSSRVFEGAEYSRLVRCTLVISPGNSVSFSVNEGNFAIYNASEPPAFSTFANSPYIPFVIELLEYIQYEGGYEDGYLSGVTQGASKSYQNGYEDGLLSGLQSSVENLKSYIFENATYRLYYSQSGTAYSYVDVTPSSSVNGFTLNVSDILKQVFGADKPDEQIESIDIDHAYLEVRFDSDTFPLYDSVSFYLSSTTAFESITFFDHTFGTSYLGSLSYNSNVGYRMVLNSLITKGLVLGGFNIGFYGFDAMLTDVICTVYSTDISYDAGYRDGYNDSTLSGAADYIEGAFNEGFIQGRDEGYEEGMLLAEQGNFNALILTVVQTPFNVLRDFLNFEILGVNMLAFVGSLLTFAILIFIVKRVVL